MKKFFVKIFFIFVILLLWPASEAHASGTLRFDDNYTYSAMSGKMYVNHWTNVRKEPCVKGEKVGELVAEEEFGVWGRCNETGWYGIWYDGDAYYISDKYVMDFVVEYLTDDGIIVSPVDIRKWPNDNAEIIGHLENEDSTSYGVYGITNDGLYYQIKVEESYGFVPVTSVEIVELVTEDPVEETAFDRFSEIFFDVLYKVLKIIGWGIIGIIFGILVLLPFVLLIVGACTDGSKSGANCKSPKKKDTSLFGIDWDGDGKVSAADDFLTMDLLDDD